jgi:hypothetical protein
MTADLPTADVRAPRVEAGHHVLTQTFPIRPPTANDVVGIPATILRRCRGCLQSVADQRVSDSEILLGAALLAAGGILGALISGVALASWLGVLFFVCLPPLAAGCGVAGALRRHFTRRARRQVAADLLGMLRARDLPND